MYLDIYYQQQFNAQIDEIDPEKILLKKIQNYQTEKAALSKKRLINQYNYLGGNSSMPAGMPITGTFDNDMKM
jgi:hypothetical protein